MDYLIIGLILNITSWVVSWVRLLPPVNQFTFFPLWVGYILIVNGVSEILLDKSLLRKLKSRFILLFIFSIPFWWMFEYLDRFTRNWKYLIPGHVGLLEYYLRGSLDFSTVIPAILSTSFLFYNSLQKIKKLKSRKFRAKSITVFNLFLLGVISICLVFIIPKLAFALMWLGIILIVDPINYKLGFPSLLKSIRKGELNLVVAIFFASLFTGFLWEMWNFYASPKWIYDVAYVGYFKVFEMPILGYLGYPFFGMEIYSYTGLIFGFLKNKSGYRLYSKELLE